MALICACLFGAGDAAARPGWQYPIRPLKIQHTAMSPGTGGLYGMVRTNGRQFHEAYDIAAPYNRRTKRGVTFQPAAAGTVGRRALHRSVSSGSTFTVGPR